MKAIRGFTVRTVLPEKISGLDRLAANLRWSWHRPTAELFRDLDPHGWEVVGQNPRALLRRFDRASLARLAADAPLVARIQEQAAELDGYLLAPRWYQGLESRPPAAIAYFSPEYGISALLPQYSGGLGILAGDHLKAASDLGVPLVGVGLLYQAGYFHQSLSPEAWQQETYPALEPAGLPLTALREADGSEVTVALPLPDGRQLQARIWRAHVGRVPLLLLDSNVPGNDEAARAITDRLYGGGGDYRLQQELLLGMGGVKALRIHSRLTGAPEPEVFHTNEGHAGFLGIERIRELISEGLDFESAVAAVRASTLFTTHTPVPAGIDRFEAAQVSRFLEAGLAPGVPTASVLALGSDTELGGSQDIFNMAAMGLRLAQRANGVSQLHGHVSRDMFSGLYPGFEASETPIGSITNGVHESTWVDPRITRLTAAEQFTDEQLWAVRRELRVQLIDDVRSRLRASWLERGATAMELGWTDSVLDPDVLTLGFARRVPTYKRLTLMLRDPVRLKAALLHPTRPIQLVIAGKSHPADEAGKQMIQELVQFTDDPAVRHRIIFLPNYDMAMAGTLFPGCDVWLNNPLRPLEACGTSGMKAALNGGLNLSVLDGWWDEMYDGDNGWAIPTAAEGSSADDRDDFEATALYELIERTVAPRFYGQETHPSLEDGPAPGQGPLPLTWLAMMRHTLAELGPQVSAERMVKDYVNTLYLPAAEAGRIACAEDFAGARSVASFIREVSTVWPEVSIEHVEAPDMGPELGLGDAFTLEAYLRLGGLDAAAVQVEAVHGRIGADGQLTEPTVHPLNMAEELGNGRFRFRGTWTLERAGDFGYAVRVVPAHPLVASPAELGLVATTGS
ncbi:alpha-glucan family phosphorylase [Arthrobacter rhombi]|uniref:glycogen phosphorylase n=1 Tax=Arthrobacter rhombi TaxID=71253 RepID=A0A1R4F7H6_9MICC|nr:alpha-glucan family phosphorylase [Arthrobacter rhombi]SJM51803.1 Glycogen phosphorylase [Arthrobacter rhombi]